MHQDFKMNVSIKKPYIWAQDVLRDRIEYMASRRRIQKGKIKIEIVIDQRKISIKQEYRPLQTVKIN